MKFVVMVYLFSSLFFLAGCETVHKTTKAAGTVVGEGTAAAGGLTEGATEGYRGAETKEENPYDR